MYDFVRVKNVNFEKYIFSLSVKEKGVNCMYLYIYTGKHIDMDNPYVLPVESCMLDDPLSVDSESSIVDWGLYYESRGIDLSSPIAILLQWPLTVFFIIKYLMNGK